MYIYIHNGALISCKGIIYICIYVKKKHTMHIHEHGDLKAKEL